MPGGSLAVAKGDEIVPLINKIAKSFQNVVLTQDWHTPGHISFASSHPGKKPFESDQAALRQPDPVARSLRAGHRRRRPHKDLDIPHAQLVIRKGYHPKVDSYSAFIEADGKIKTGLDGYLKGRGIKTIFVGGLATDFCVAWTALDARKLGLAAYVIEDACRGIDTQGSLAAAWNNMEKAGVKRIQSADLALGLSVITGPSRPEPCAADPGRRVRGGWIPEWQFRDDSITLRQRGDQGAEGDLVALA